MTLTNSQHKRVLSIVFNMRGVGFAVLDGATVLTNWGIKKVTAKESAAALTKIEKLISLYTPDVIVFEDLDLSPFRHSARIKALSATLEKLTAKFGIHVTALSLFDVKKCLFTTGEGTKHEMAQALTSRFPDELGHLLPAKRLSWKTEHYRMGIFDAVALAVAFVCVDTAR